MLRSMKAARGSWLGIPAAIILYIIVSAVPWYPEAAVRGAAALVAATLLLWIGEFAPLGIVALLIPIGATLSGLLSWKDAVAAWGDPVVFLFMGAFLLARGLEKFGAFDGLLSSPTIQALGRRPLQFSLVVLLLSGAVSTFQNNTAVTAMLLPVVLALARRSNDPAAPLLALSYGATFGGLATPVGTAPNFLGFAAIKNIAPEFNFLSWLAVGIPAWIGTTAISWAALTIAAWLSSRRSASSPVNARFVSRGDATSTPLSGKAAFEADLAGEISDDSPTERRTGRRWVMAAFALTAGLWLIPGVMLSLAESPNEALPEALARVLPQSAVDGLQRIGAVDAKLSLRAALDRYVPEALPPVLAATLLFLVRTRGRGVLERHDLQNIDWDTLFLIAGGLCLGKVLESSGAAEALAREVASLHASPTMTLLAVGAVTVLLSELTSNTATAALLVPVATRLAEHVHIAPVQMILLVALTASLGFALPISTPPNALVYGTGLIRLRRMVGIGLLVDVLSLAWVVACVGWFGSFAAK